MPEDVIPGGGSEPEVIQQDVNNNPEPSEQEQVSGEPQASPEGSGVKQTPEDKVDGRGVPYQNVAHEALRKINELQTNLPNILKSVVGEQFQEQQSQQQQSQ